MRTILPALFLAATTALAQDSREATPPSRAWDFTGDLLIRYDKAEGIPRRVGGVVDPYELERTRLQLRPGILFTPMPWATIEARAAIHVDSKENGYYRLADGTSKRIVANDHFVFSGRQDNFEPNSVVIDRLNLQLRPTAGSMITVGKFENPFDTTEALWDNDLQPEGVAGSVDFGSPDALHYRVTAAGFFGTQLYGDESQIFGGQVGIVGGSGWPVTMSLSLGFFSFDELDVLARRNWRQNQTVVVDGVRQFRSDFEIGDAVLRVGTDRLPVPLQVHFDYIENFGADEGNEQGYEAGLRVGPFGGAGNVRLLYVFQDLDRDAVMTGFNTDDWYLHSWYRGALYRASASVWRDFDLRVTYIDLRHHEPIAPGNREIGDLTRWFVDVVKRF